MVFTFAPNVLISHLKAALRFVSTDPERFEITSIRLEAREGAARFIATDGFRLWCAIAKCSVKGSASILIHGQDVSRVLKMLDKKHGEVILTLEENNVLSVGQRENTLRFKAVDLSNAEKQFPEYSALLTPMVPADTPRAAISLSGGFLTDALASFADVCDPEVLKTAGSTVRIFPGASLFSTVTLTSPGTEAIALILPLQASKWEEAVVEVDELLLRFKTAPVPSRKKKTV